MSVPVFTFQIKYDILPGLVTVGKYDGSHHCLTAATTGAKILIHSPHRTNREISFLNVHESVIAICAGKLNPNEDKDVLVIGSPSSVLVYHVDNNSELFFKEIPDGVTAVAIGNLEKYPSPLLIVGGNCSIQGFDWKGQELYWTVTGDTVTSLAMVDINQDGQNELLVGSDDFEIRVFKEDAIIHEITETGSAISMIGFKDNKFAYALSNGTVGMYERLQRIWRIKSQSRIQCLGSYDLDGDGVDELITGRSDGRFDVRNCRNSEIIFKDVLNHGIAGIVSGDYRRAGRNQLIIVSENGEVRGYDSTSLKHDSRVQADELRNLFLRKQALSAEFKSYNVAHLPTPGIPANTSVTAEVIPSMKNERFPMNHILISLSSNNSMYIRVACVLAEGLFDGESLVTHPQSNQVTSKLEIALVPPKETVSDIDIRVFLSNEMYSDQFFVFNIHHHLPRFSMYLLIPYNAPEEPPSYVNFQLSERKQRLDLWLNQSFIVPEALPVKTSSNIDWSVGIKSLRDGSAVNIKYSFGLMTIVTENMELASEIIQSIANYLNVTKLEAYVDFPKVFEEVEVILSQIKNLQQNASKMSATLADNAGLLRSLIVQAEDARIIGHRQDFRDSYTQLQQMNDEMLRNHTLYCNNHEELMKILRKINLIIQHAARMRVDKNGNDFISQCRRAVADYNYNILVKLIRTGNK